MAGFDLLTGSPEHAAAYQALINASYNIRTHTNTAGGNEDQAIFPSSVYCPGTARNAQQNINNHQNGSNNFNHKLDTDPATQATLLQGMARIDLTHINAIGPDSLRTIVGNAHVHPRVGSSSSHGSSSTDRLSVSSGTRQIPAYYYKATDYQSSEKTGNDKGKGSEKTNSSPPTTISPDSTSANDGSSNAKTQGQKLNAPDRTPDRVPGWGLPRFRGQVLPVREPVNADSQSNFPGGPCANLSGQVQPQSQQSGSAPSLNRDFIPQPGVGMPSTHRNGTKPLNSQAPIGTGRWGHHPLRELLTPQATSVWSQQNPRPAVAQKGFQSYAPVGEFRPMNAITRTFLRPECDPQKDLKMAQGVSANYKGDALNPRNLSDDIPECKNVSFFLTNLPADVTYSQLLGQIRGMGRVWATVINPPDGHEHFTSAAKLVFFELAAAQRFYAHCRNPARRLIISSYAVKIVRNRVRKAEEDVGGYHSRVLVVTGELSFVNKDTLLRYFRTKLDFDTEDVIAHVQDPQTGMGELEIRFACYRNQSESARQALSKEYPPGATLPDGRMSPIWELRYGVDPCSI
ncbi:hypothetical protein COL5a_004001 [Colletotrichum fioriniae]|uniref:uncharacterized protein n=1 Tax=Colletotrichum fioriniae TaxID=710243 RepID=UPI00230045F9|nr:uncharacterized protein COL516b_000077 [Colletotrichum fioriniae]KAJ0313150.1 hypothetical protein COL516b_000077 [Colletotrichum fioriniae]KAJ0329443.1 hypothetical protein COL5a_004001 [Colletotrichum fioriniae]KAJ3948520.1 hypothetical protein N0V96_002775 [Colletotrichum fioriniae]